MTALSDAGARPAKPLQVPSIALIGLEGSGKTVLATTLAKRLSTVDGRGVFLNPLGTKTLKYVENVWETLQSGEWPASTPPGELFELRWKLQIVGECDCELRLIDAAGQDLRLLFDDEQYEDLDSLPAHLRSLAEYCRSADIILFLINLKDFVGESAPSQRTANEAAIKSAMDHLCSDPNKRVCLLLTQADQYVTLAQECGSWRKLLAHHVPYISAAYAQINAIKVLPVAAVRNTNVVIDEAGPRRVPAAGFRSIGLDVVVDWLTTQVKEMQDRRHKHAAPTATDLPPSPMAAAPPSPPTRNDGDLKNIASGIFFLGILVLFLVLLIRGCSTPGSSEPPLPSKPPPPRVTYKWGITWGVFNDDVWVTNTSRTTLTNVEVTVNVEKEGRRWSLPLRTAGIYSWQTYTWSNVLSVPGGEPVSGTAMLKCDQAPQGVPMSRSR